jgi:hypothetical protein
LLRRACDVLLLPEDVCQYKVHLRDPMERIQPPRAPPPSVLPPVCPPCCATAHGRRTNAISPERMSRRSSVKGMRNLHFGSEQAAAELLLQGLGMPRRLRLSISITRCEIVTHFLLAYYCSHIGAITISYVTVLFFREVSRRKKDTS